MLLLFQQTSFPLCPSGVGFFNTLIYCKIEDKADICKIPTACKCLTAKNCNAVFTLMKKHKQIFVSELTKNVNLLEENVSATVKAPLKIFSNMPTRRRLAPPIRTFSLIRQNFLFPLLVAL